MSSDVGVGARGGRDGVYKKKSPLPGAMLLPPVKPDLIMVA